MCGGPSQGPECPRTSIIPGYTISWALAIPMYGYWEGGGRGSTHPVPTRGSTRYTTLPVPTLPHPLTHGPATMFVPSDMQFGVDQGDPRGRIRTAGMGTATGCRTPHLTQARRPPGPALWACCEAAPWPRTTVLHDSSVYLSISQYISVF